MAKKLAIKGHTTRGNEVIELLEMLGGVASAAKGFTESYCYYISENTITNYISWDYIDSKEIDKCKVFTLEEFLEKYPFKVGDKVYIYVQTDDFDGMCDVKVTEITSMRWNPVMCEIVYKIKDANRDFYKEELKPYKEEVNMKENKLLGTASNPVETKSYTISLKDSEVVNNSIDAAEFMQFGKIATVCFNTENYENEVELKLGDYEIVVRDGKTYVVLKKPKYPTSYSDCCDILGFKNRNKTEQQFLNSCDLYDFELMTKLSMLKVCRDAYWKIAGEEMGLGKPWKPDMSKDEFSYAISYQFGYVQKNEIRYKNAILVFPTKEMRDTFYDNFKEEIENCKELL